MTIPSHHSFQTIYSETDACTWPYMVIKGEAGGSSEAEEEPPIYGEEPHGDVDERRNQVAKEGARGGTRRREGGRREREERGRRRGAGRG